MAKKGSLLADEPALASHAALWLATMVGEFVVGHLHVVSAGQWSALQSTLIPGVTTVLLSLFAVLTRRVVTPAAKVAQKVEDAVTLSLAGAGVTVTLPSVEDAFSAAGVVVGAEPATPAAPPVATVRDPYASPVAA